MFDMVMKRSKKLTFVFFNCLSCLKQCKDLHCELVDFLAKELQVKTEHLDMLRKENKGGVMVLTLSRVQRNISQCQQN